MRGSQTDPGEIIFDALADARRRRLLGLVRASDDPIPIADAATEVVVAEQRRQIVPADDCDRSHRTLVHDHVPRLVDAGLLDRVRWNPESGVRIERERCVGGDSEHGTTDGGDSDRERGTTVGDESNRERGTTVGDESNRERGTTDGGESDRERAAANGVGGAGGGRPITDALVQGDDPALEAGWVRRLLDDTGPPDDRTLDEVLKVVAPARRRTTLAVLADRKTSIHRSDLATTIAAREAGTRLADVPEARTQTAVAALHHADLPALSDAGLVSVDGESVSIVADHPLWAADWIAGSPLGDVAALVESASPRHGTAESPDDARCERVPGADADATTPVGRATPTEVDSVSRGSDSTATGDCWTIEGGDAVLQRGREIADRAEDELLVTLPDTRTVDPECLERLRDATGRGVAVYVASGCQNVRSLVRSAVPDAILCAPQLDWINIPLEGFHLGRVVFADRDAVMLVTTRTGADGSVEQTAITGTGPDNTLVTLADELLGPRLDRLRGTRARDGSSEPLPI